MEVVCPTCKETFTLNYKPKKKRAAKCPVCAKAARNNGLTSFMRKPSREGRLPTVEQVFFGRK